MLIFVHKIAVNESSGNLLQVVSSMARGLGVSFVVSLAAHANDKITGSAPGALGVVMANIHVDGFVTLLLVTINLHAHDTGELVQKFLVSGFLILSGNFGAVESSLGKILGIPERSASISDVFTTAPRAAIDSITSIGVGDRLANVFIGSGETGHEGILEHLMERFNSSLHGRADGAEPRELSSTLMVVLFIHELLSVEVVLRLFVSGDTQHFVKFIRLKSRSHAHLSRMSEGLQLLLHSHVGGGKESGEDKEEHGHTS